MDDPLSTGLLSSFFGNKANIFMLVALVILISLSAFFSASETAFTSINTVRLRNLAKTKKSCAVALKLQEKYEKLISTILIGNNIVNIAATSLATVFFTNLLGGELGVTIATIVLTVAILIFGEITPKSIAKEIPEKVVAFSAYPLRVLYIILTPINFLFNALAKGFNKLFRLNKNKSTLTEEEFKMLVSDITKEGVLEQEEHDVIQNTIKSDDRVVAAIMTPIDDVEYIKSSERWENVLENFKTYNYSRLPVKREEKFIGLLYQKDFYEALLDGDKEWQSLIRDEISVKPNMRIFSLFKLMQKECQHMAIVTNKDKTPVGIVTMEDIMEEIFGEIEDEYDQERDDAEEEEDLKEEKRAALKEAALDKCNKNEGKRLKKA